MIRLAYVCIDPGVPVFGTKGASVHIQEIIRSWRTLGAEVAIYCTRAGSTVPPDMGDMRVVEHRLPKSTGPDRERAQAKAADTLAAQAIKDGADAVYERYSLFSDALERITTALDVPGLLEVNAPLIDEQRTHRELQDEDAALVCLRRQGAAAVRIACVSAPVADWVAERIDAGAHDRVVVAPNGVNCARIQPTAEAEGRPVVVFVGTLKPWHGVRTLIEAKAAASGDWALKIVGDGPQGPELRALAASLDVDVNFTGAVPPEDIPAALAGCAVAAAPYPATGQASEQYFSPLKMYEYLAAGLPVVASRLGQVPDIIEHGITGLLVEPSRPDELAAAIDELAAAPQGRAAMSDAARKLAVDRYGWDEVLAGIIEGVAL
ncbi:glycosyltransferase family 4 protein [Arthrobacter castelli]|uniref:glycosyltransferase family 4 protein n=1 Tax=Arthrobacter castelli TaxID=271431 RepID=UPI001FDECA1A|nr:glycosyltransferase family 4 protein [Arthrobacter castelli]